jgi:hypothetical protein
MVMPSSFAGFVQGGRWKVLQHTPAPWMRQFVALTVTGREEGKDAEPADSGRWNG